MLPNSNPPLNKILKKSRGGQHSNSNIIWYINGIHKPTCFFVPDVQDWQCKSRAHGNVKLEELPEGWWISLFLFFSRVEHLIFHEVAILVHQIMSNSQFVKIRSLPSCCHGWIIAQTWQIKYLSKSTPYILGADLWSFTAIWHNSRTT